MSATLPSDACCSAILGPPLLCESSTVDGDMVQPPLATGSREMGASLRVPIPDHRTKSWCHAPPLLCRAVGHIGPAVLRKGAHADCCGSSLQHEELSCDFCRPVVAHLACGFLFCLGRPPVLCRAAKQASLMLVRTVPRRPLMPPGRARRALRPALQHVVAAHSAK